MCCEAAQQLRPDQHEWAQYKTLEELHSDLLLMIKNAKLYNRDVPALVQVLNVCKLAALLSVSVDMDRHRVTKRNLVWPKMRRLQSCASCRQSKRNRQLQLRLRLRPGLGLHLRWMLRHR